MVVVKKADTYSMEEERPKNGRGRPGRPRNETHPDNATERESQPNGHSRRQRTPRSDKAVISRLDPNRPLYPLSAAAEWLRLHPRTLRIYEAEELVIPHRTQTKRRKYSYNDIRKFAFIQFLTSKKGVNLSGVKIILMMLEEFKKNSPDPVSYFFPDYEEEV
jgi:hypothetical protein